MNGISGDHSSQLPDAPASAVDTAGVPRLGVFRGTLREVGLDRYASPFELRWRRKWWQYVSIVSPEVIAAMAVVNLGYVGLVFVTAWDRVSQVWYERESLVPLALGISTSGEPAASEMRWAGRQGEVRLLTTPERRSAHVRMLTPRGLVALDLTMAGPGAGGPGLAVDPLTVIGRLGERALNVTHKEAGVPVRGTITLGPKPIQLEPDRAHALIDWTQGIPPASVSWNWAMGTGRATNGSAIGFNFCQGYCDPAHSENAVWVNGRVHPAGPVVFECGADRTAQWRIRSAAGELDLVFRPEAERSEDTNLVVVRSRYRQPVGSFGGHLPGADGVPLELQEASGVVEDHQARW